LATRRSRGLSVCDAVRETPLRTGAEISGARFHRAEHVENVLHVGATTVILAPALSIAGSPTPAAVMPALASAQSVLSRCSRSQAVAREPVLGKEQGHARTISSSLHSATSTGFSRKRTWRCLSSTAKPQTRFHNSKSNPKRERG